MSTKNLIELAKVVAESRQDVEFAKRERASAEESMAATAEGQSFQLCAEHLIKDQETLSQAETMLKSAVLEVYKESGERKPIEKTEVKIYKSLKYDSAEVLTWCRDNAPSLLIVNKKPFEKTAVEIGAPVEVKEEPKCTIGQDLSIYLDSATEPASV